jgi:hypothetical protein
MTPKKRLITHKKIFNEKTNTQSNIIRIQSIIRKYSTKQKLHHFVPAKSGHKNYLLYWNIRKIKTF